MTNQQMHIHKYVQSHMIMLHQPVSVMPVTIVKVSNNMLVKNI